MMLRAKLNSINWTVIDSFNRNTVVLKLDNVNCFQFEFEKTFGFLDEYTQEQFKVHKEEVMQEVKFKDEGYELEVVSDQLLMMQSEGLQIGKLFVRNFLCSPQNRVQPTHLLPLFKG